VYWIATIFFGACLAVIVHPLVFRHAGALTLDADGFRTSNGLFHWNCRWSDVSGFDAQKSGIASHVSFRNASRQGRVRLLFGFGSDWLQSMYSMSAPDLAELLNRWRARALARGLKAKP
jgi:hypothetical protein